MVDLLIYFLIFMFFLGIGQLLWGIIHPIASKNRDLRRHYGYYWLGVLAYAIGMSPSYFIDGYHGPFEVILTLWLVGFFFIGAWSLAIYQVVIIAKKGRFGKRHEAEQPEGELEFQDFGEISA